VLLEFIPGQKQQFDFFEQAMQAGFNGKVLTVTAGLSEIESAELIRLGVAGIFMKHNSVVALSDGIRQVMGGQTWFEHQYLTALLKASGSRNLSSQQSGSQFSRREREVLALILDGCTNKQIAVRLQTSEGAIKSAVRQLFHKAGVRTRSQLVRVAFELRQSPLK
jgi:two-component system nitrate/nitrite response regulator NarL